jgi:uncharacterized membrane protein
MLTSLYTTAVYGYFVPMTVPHDCTAAKAMKAPATKIVGNIVDVGLTFWPYVILVIVALLLLVGLLAGPRSTLMKALVTVIGLAIVAGILFNNDGFLSAITGTPKGC